MPSLYYKIIPYNLRRSQCKSRKSIFHVEKCATRDFFVEEFVVEMFGGKMIRKNVRNVTFGDVSFRVNIVPRLNAWCSRISRHLPY